MTYKILAVDDNPVNLDLIEKSMYDSRFTILRATSGPEALALAQNECPDLILLDVMMPYMDGFEVCRRLQADDTTKYIPVIFVSAQNEAMDKARGISLGGVDYLTKPFNALELTTRIRSHLEQRQNTVRILQEMETLREQFSVNGYRERPDREGMDRLWLENYVESNGPITVAARTAVSSEPAVSVFMPFITSPEQVLGISFMTQQKTAAAKAIQLMLQSFIHGYLKGLGQESLNRDSMIHLFELILQHFAPDVYGVGFTFSMILLDRTERLLSVCSVHQPLPFVFTPYRELIRVAGPPIPLRERYDEFVTTIVMPVEDEILLVFFNPLPESEDLAGLAVLMKNMTWTGSVNVEANLDQIISHIPPQKHDQLLAVIHTL